VAKTPIFSKLLELMSAVEKIPGIAVLGTIITHNLIRDSKPCKYFLQVVNDTGDSVLTQLFNFKVF